MLTQISPGLGRSNVMLHSFTSCISNTPKEFSRAPEMSLREIFPQPKMFLHQHPRGIALKQLQSSTNTHCWRQFNEEMDVVNCNMQFINSATISPSCCIQESLAINSSSEKLKGIHVIFNFPDKMESILSEGMFPSFQIHFLTPQTFIRNKVLTIFDFNLVQEGVLDPSCTNTSQELNFAGGNSSPRLKARVSLPQM
mgnify:CR=1 FL=1